MPTAKKLRDLEIRRVWPDPATITAAGYPALLEVPVLFDADWRYLPEANQYLIWRAHPDRFGEHGKHPPTRQSIANYSSWLINFLRWCLWRDLDWRHVGYSQHVSGMYLADQVDGHWSESYLRSRRREGLDLETTVRYRVEEAVSFLQWAATRGLRPAIEVPYRQMRMYFRSGIGLDGRSYLKETKVRADATRQKVPGALRLPTRDEIVPWLRELGERHGYVYELVAKLILRTGLRRGTAVTWPVDLPPEDRRKWKIVDQHVEVRVAHELKGKKALDKSGRRSIPLRKLVMLIPLELAEEMERYRLDHRPAALYKYVRAGENISAEEFERRRSEPEPRDLFLSPHTGRPFTREHFTAVWSDCEALPFPGFSVHKGRHFFACMEMLDAIQLAYDSLNLHGRERVVKLGIGWQLEIAGFVIERLRQQLGHISASTTRQYMNWIAGIVRRDLYLAWHEALEQP